MTLTERAVNAYAQVAGEREAARAAEHQRRKNEVDEFYKEAVQELQKQAREKLGYDLEAAKCTPRSMGIDLYSHSLPEANADNFTLTLVPVNDELKLFYFSDRRLMMSLEQEINSLEDLGEAMALFEIHRQKFQTM